MRIAELIALLLQFPADAHVDIEEDQLVFSHAVHGRHESAGRIDHALQNLLGRGLARVGTRETGGRPAEVWTPT